MQSPVPEAIQQLAVLHVKEVSTSYEQMMAPRKTQLAEIFEAYSSFKEKKERNWSTSFKINKAHEIIEKVVPSLTAKEPRWIVSIKNPKAFNDTEEITRVKEAMIAEQGRENIVDIDNMVMGQKKESVQEIADAIQDYLTYLFEEYNYMDQIEIWSKNVCADGKGYVRVGYEFEKTFSSKLVPAIDQATGQPLQDQSGGLMYQKVTEPVIVGEHPTIDIINWADIWYDPRFISSTARPATVINKKGVRMADLLRYKDRYINLDKLAAMIVLSEASASVGSDSFGAQLRAIAGIQGDVACSPLKKNELSLKIYEGFFSHTGEAKDEKLYEITTINDFLCIGLKEITHRKIEEAKCFPNTKDGNAVGFVEPILGLQEEFNFKKNSANEFINKALQRQRVWSENSGIDPDSLNDPIIPTSADGPTAIANIPEVPMANVNADYFGDANDFERQIQSATHTIDTSNPRSQNALTDTATGAKIKFYESNKVLDAVRRRFERAMVRLAYKLLECAFENMSDNIVFKKMKTEGYWYVNKEAFRDALNKYQIKIEAGSSSFTDLEDRRSEALAFTNIMTQIDAKLAESGAPQRVDFSVLAEDIANTFEKKDLQRYLKTVNLQPSIPTVGGVSVGQKLAGPPERMTGAEKITKEVVGQI